MGFFTSKNGAEAKPRIELDFFTKEMGLKPRPRRAALWSCLIIKSTILVFICEFY